MENYNLKMISNFETLKAFKHGKYWYIIDCTEGCGNPYQNAIGGYHGSYMALLAYAQLNYTGIYK
jgi:hypothetical protein